VKGKSNGEHQPEGLRTGESCPTAFLGGTVTTLRDVGATALSLEEESTIRRGRERAVPERGLIIFTGWCGKVANEGDVDFMAGKNGRRQCGGSRRNVMIEGRESLNIHSIGKNGRKKGEKGRGAGITKKGWERG